MDPCNWFCGRGSHINIFIDSYNSPIVKESLSLTFRSALLCRATEVSWINDIAEEEVPACSLRRVIKHEDSLKKHFSFSVPVLQWRDSFIYSHWQTLRHEPLPYGWKDQPFHGKPSLQSL